MSQIGSFKKVGNEFHGEISTLTIQARSVSIVPGENGNGNAPTHRVFIGTVEIGVAWSKKSKDDRPYLSVKLDDPSFIAPIFAQLFEGAEDGHDLVWSRSPGRRGDS